jgi:hypothetical protein
MYLLQPLENEEYITANQFLLISLYIIYLRVTQCFQPVCRRCALLIPGDHRLVGVDHHVRDCDVGRVHDVAEMLRVVVCPLEVVAPLVGERVTPADIGRPVVAFEGHCDIVRQRLRVEGRKRK